MKYCEYCGEENEKELVFCKKCGENLNYEAVEEHSTVKEKKSKGKTKKKVKKVKKQKKNRAKQRRQQDPEVVHKMSFLQKCVMFLMAIMILALTAVIGAFIYYHYNGTSVSVPSVVGMTYEEATEVLSKEKLKVTKVNQMTEHDEEVGIVLEQSPRDGKKISTQSHVKLKVGIKDDRYLVPDFIGMSARTAIAILKEAGVNYKITAYDSNHTSGMTDGIVETQSIKDGQKIRKTDTITLSISEIVEEPTLTDNPVISPEATPDIEEGAE